MVLVGRMCLLRCMVLSLIVSDLSIIVGFGMNFDLFGWCLGFGMCVVE